MSLVGEARREEDEERMKRRRKRRGLKGRREVQEEEPGKGPPQAKKSHRGHVLFCFLAQRAWQVLILDFYRGSAREHFINREQKRKTGRCVCVGGVPFSQVSSLLHSTTPHASSYSTTLPRFQFPNCGGGGSSCSFLSSCSSHSLLCMRVQTLRNS